MRRLVLGTTFLTVLGVTEASACAFTPFHFSYYGSSASSDMLANSGRPCTINLSTGGRHSFSAIVISAQARNGMARAGAQAGAAEGFARAADVPRAPSVARLPRRSDPPPPGSGHIRPHRWRGSPRNSTQPAAGVSSSVDVPR